MKMKLEELVSPEASPALGPYCHGRKYGDMIITSGQIPLTKDGEYVFEIKQATTLLLNNSFKHCGSRRRMQGEHCQGGCLY